MMLPAAHRQTLHRAKNAHLRLVAPTNIKQTAAPRGQFHGGHGARQGRSERPETKPDGKPGWQMFFFNRGYDVYVSDAVERGRASWARYPEFFKSEPLFRSKKEAWELFRFGPTGSYDPNPADRRLFPDSQFPTEALDQFAKQGFRVG